MLQLQRASCHIMAKNQLLTFTLVDSEGKGFLHLAKAASNYPFFRIAGLCRNRGERPDIAIDVTVYT